MTDASFPRKAFTIFCDGSYNLYGSKDLGAGIVIVTDDPLRPIIISEKVMDNSSYEGLNENAQIAEIAAIYLALKTLPDGADALVFNDSKSTVAFLNGGKQRIGKDNPTIGQLHGLFLDECQRLGNVKLHGSSDVFGTGARLSMSQINLYDVLAHNAAIAASGSLNWKETPPDYEGDFGFQRLFGSNPPRQKDPFAALAVLVPDQPMPGMS